MTYRIVEDKITKTYSEYKIQKRIFFMWFDVNVDPQYEASLESAQKWIELKEKGFPVQKYFYDK